MKELFNSLPRTDSDKLVLLDTCFFLDCFTRQQVKELEKLCETRKVAVTSFNAEELVFVLQRNLEHHVKDHIRRFLKDRIDLLVYEIPVHPGDVSSEKKFISSVDENLLKDVQDPSDAVLIAAAIRTNSNVLTKDKHHLFTSRLKNYLRDYNIKVLKELKDI